MTGFTADWLRLREPFDLAARRLAAADLDVAGLAAWLHAGVAPGTPLPVLDLACGTGANLRALAPTLRGAQRWCMVDHDPALLAALPDELSAWAAREGHVASTSSDTLRIQGKDWSAQVHTLTIDLARDLAVVPFAQARLVTASALLDLVGGAWLDALAAQVAAAGAATLFALNVDGDTAWQPADPDDAAVHRWFGAHQLRDKGFGPALGPDAAARAAQALGAAGYGVHQASSPWLLRAPDPAAASLQQAMVDGMAAAATEQAPHAAQRIAAWRTRRLAQGGFASLRVGHIDLLAWPQG